MSKLFQKSKKDFDVILLAIASFLFGLSIAYGQTLPDVGRQIAESSDMSYITDQCMLSYDVDSEHLMCIGPAATACAGYLKSNGTEYVCDEISLSDISDGSSAVGDPISLEVRPDIGQQQPEHLGLYATEYGGFTYLYGVDDTDVEFAYGRDSYIVVKNDTGSTIARGKAVFPSGVDGFVHTVALAQSDTPLGMPMIGLTIDEIADGAKGRVQTAGLYGPIDTSAFSAGDWLYATSTPGVLSATLPDPTTELSQSIGQVIASDATNGYIFVNPSATAYAPLGFGFRDTIYIGGVIQAANGGTGHGVWTQGAVPFGHTDSQLTEDATNLSYIDQYNQLCVGGGYSIFPSTDYNGISVYDDVIPYVSATGFNGSDAGGTFLAGQCGGSNAARAAITSGEAIGQYGFMGCKAADEAITDWYFGARMHAEASENWSNTQRGTKLVLESTRNGATVTKHMIELGGAYDAMIPDGVLWDWSAPDMNSTTEGIKLPQAASCSSATAEGQICWDTDDNKMYSGNGSGSTLIGPITGEVKTVNIEANQFVPDGTYCTQPQQISLASEEKTYAMNCASNASAKFTFKYMMPSRWDAGTVNVRLAYVSSGTDTGSMKVDMACKCGVYSATWGTAVAIDKALSGTPGLAVYETSAAITPGGSCAAGELLRCMGQIDTGRTDTAATTYILAGNLKYTTNAATD